MFSYKETEQSPPLKKQKLETEEFIASSNSTSSSSSFSKNRAFVGQSKDTPGIYVGAGQITKNAPCSTLFVTQVPSKIPPSSVRALFEKEPGFIGSRNVRNIYFIDFVTIPVASVAMRKYQGYQFPDHPTKSGLCIDYDKDSAEKRSRQVEKSRIREFIQRDKRFVVNIHCGICETQALSLRLLPPLSLPALRRRDYDGSIVLDATRLVLEHFLVRGGVVPEFQPAGVELRTHLLCKSCEAELGYSSVGENEQIRFIFLHPYAVRALDYKGQYTRVNPILETQTESPTSLNPTDMSLGDEP